ncbi:hypothetical protein JCM9957A_24810 [Kineosporia succinea]
MTSLVTPAPGTASALACGLTPGLAETCGEALAEGAALTLAEGSGDAAAALDEPSPENPPETTTPTTTPADSMTAPDPILRTSDKGSDQYCRFVTRALLNNFCPM